MSATAIPQTGGDLGTYLMVIEWSDEDAAFVVTVPELPGCATHGETYAAAVRQGEDAIVTWLATAQAWSDPIPPPRRFDVAVMPLTHQPSSDDETLPALHLWIG